MTTMTRGNWTTERPTRHGWYWFRANDQSPPAMCRATPVIVLVTNFENKGLSVFFPQAGRFTVELMGGEFDGPIPEPA